MTSKARCIFEAIDGSRYSYKPTSLEVHRHGTRAVDTAKATFSGRINADTGDTMYVVMDNFDLDHLVGMWNFERHGKDESGSFNHFIRSTSPSVELHELPSQFVPTSGNNRLKGKTRFYVPSNTQYRPTSNISATEEFDFYAWMSLQFLPTTFVEYNHLYISDLTPTLSSDLRVHTYTNGTNYWIRVNKSGATLRYLTPINGPSLGIPFLLRLTGKKSGNRHLITLYFNGQRVSEILATLGSSITPSFFSRLNCYVYHARLYSGRLPDESSKKMLNTLPPVLSMKFGGNVWKKQDRIASTKVDAQGFGQDILFSVVQFPDTLTGTAYARATFNSSNARYEKGLTASYILNDILTRLNFTMINTTTNDYTMVGETNIRHPTISTVGALTSLSDTQIVSDPNRMVFFEDVSGKETRHVSMESQSCHINTVDSDSSLLVNDISFVSEDTNNLILASNQESIERYGTKSRKLEYEGFVANEDNAFLVNKLLDNWSEIRTRYEIVHSSHLHHLRENLRIGVVDPQHGTSGEYKIYSMSWYYPGIRTVINCGEHRFDAFDIRQRSKIDLSELKYSTFSTDFSIWIEANADFPYIRGRTGAAST